MFRIPRMEDNRSCQTCMSISMYFSGGQIDNILLQASELAVNLCYSGTLVLKLLLRMPLREEKSTVHDGGHYNHIYYNIVFSTFIAFPL